MNFSTHLFALILLLSLNASLTLAGTVPEPTDILFLIDGSGSVKPRNFDKLRVLLKNILDTLTVGPSRSHIALIQFSSRKLTKVEFNLDTFDNIKDMKTAIDDMKYQRKFTYTGYAMEMANKEVFNGKGGDRPDARNVILLFTDGHAADPHVAEAAVKDMKSRGDHVMTVGFGPERSIQRFKPELEMLSTNKDKDVFLKGFDDAYNIATRLGEMSLPRADCSSVTCQNGGSCKNKEDSFICICTEQYEGPLCNKEKGACYSQPCLNGGICSEVVDGFSCACGDKFHGERCQKEKVVCTTKNADILLIMDDSRSIRNSDYGIMKNFVTELVYRFNISEDQSRVALIQFSSKENTEVEFYLDSYYDKPSLMRRIESLRQSDGSSTYTDLALKLAREKIFDEKRGDRKSIRDVIVLLTDGNSHDDDAAIREAGLLRDADVSIISIGIGAGEVQNDLYNFLKDLSFGSEYVFKVSFTKLETILDGVTKAACENLQET